jgi:phytoene dehydrogenase-like protein
LDIVKDTFNIDKSKIILSFSATPETFYKYINRRSVGGTPVEIQNPFWKIPSNFTPFKGVYLVGDSFFSYQGWIGISLGILNLLIGLNEKI